MNSSGNLLLGIGLGVAGAVAGAVAWGALGYYGNLEIGILAWGIGGAIGFLMVAGGARGIIGVAVAAALTLAAIGGGKVWYVNKAMGDIQSQIMAESDSYFDQAAYDEAMLDARDFQPYVDGTHASVQGVADPRERVRRFMLDHSFVEPGEAITDSDVDDFVELNQESFADLATRQPDQATWAAENREMFQSFNIADSMSMWEKLKSTLGLLDILFVFLGVATASSMVGKAGRNE
jgi:hypothetical protein